MELAAYLQELSLVVLGAMLGGGGTYVGMKGSIRAAQRERILDEVLPTVEEVLLLATDPSVEIQLLDVDAELLVVRCQALRQSVARLTVWEHREVKKLVAAACRYREIHGDTGDEKRTEIRRLNGSAHRVRESMSARFHLLPYRLLCSFRIRWHVWRNPTMR